MFSKLLQIPFRPSTMPWMRCPVCWANFRVKTIFQAAPFSEDEVNIITCGFCSWALRVRARFKWPHVCSHLRCGGNIRGKRRICPILFRRRRYEFKPKMMRSAQYGSDITPSSSTCPHRKLLPQLCGPCGHRKKDFPFDQHSRVWNCGFL